jgi:hypothetical protein
MSEGIDRCPECNRILVANRRGVLWCIKCESAGTGPSTARAGVTCTALFAVGDLVKIRPDAIYEYEVAEIRRFPHGFMVGIYDEPPSKHVDFWNASSLTLAHKANRRQ